MKWIAYTLAWVTAALLLGLATAIGYFNLGGAIGDVVYRGLFISTSMMSMGGLLGVVVWRMTGRVAWNPRKSSFLLIHVAALIVYSGLFATAWVWPTILIGRGQHLLFKLTSPPLFYNLLTGTWLYLVVAGLSYAIRLQEDIRAKEAAAAAAQILAQQAQLAAVRARINPHFLFNALHTVGALIGTEPARADQALERLGDLLRYALGADDEVPFSHEWRFTMDYLEFQQLRLGDRLRVDVEVDDDTRPILVPPLILQPLVENAVRYGIAERQDGGCIRIRARVEQGRLAVSIANDQVADSEASGMGLGIESVTRRLAALYGQEATLRLNRNGPGFVVLMEVPVRQADRPASLP